MKNVLLFILFFTLSIFGSNAQNAGIRSDNCNINIPAGTSLVIPGTVTINRNSDYILNNGNCYIGGDFKNNGNSFDITGSGTEIFNGYSNITGNSNFNNFTILPGAVVSLSNSIDIKNNWNNAGKFMHGNNIVTFSGTVPVQFIIGTGTFYKLILQNTVHFGNSKDTIENSFSNNTTGALMIDGKSSVVFKTAQVIGSKAKNFYDLEILNGETLTHNTGGGNIHVAHSFINNGNLTEGPGYTFYFDSSNGTETMSGSGTNTFGKVVVGDNGFSYPTTLNTSSNYNITGGSLKLNKNSILNNTSNTVTFSTNDAIISGTGSVNFNNIITNVNLDFGNNISTVNNTFTINNGIVSPNTPTYSSLATLVYNTTISNYLNNAEWSTGNIAGAGVPQNVSVTNSNSVAIAGNRVVPGTLTLNAGSLDINNFTLTVTGGFAGTGGNLKGSLQSNLTAGGTGTIFFDAAYNYLKNFFIKSGANLSLGNNLNITASDNTNSNSFGIITANGNLDANGFLTIKSDALGDAIIGNSTGLINGNVTIERYIPWRRAWRFLSVPLSNSLSNTQTIRDAWMEGATPNPDVNTRNDPNPGFGTEITYLHNDTANGYDENITENPSIKVWDPALNIWIPVSSTNIPINTYPAYCIFVRGSRAVDLSQGIYAPQHDATILRMEGLINQGSIIQGFSVTSAGQNVLLKNPFASPINLTGTGVSYSGATSNYFYVWDPKIGGTYGAGKYVTCNGAAWSLLGGSYDASTPVGIIQSGQAFLVQSTATSGSISITENAKTSSEFNSNGKQHKPSPVIYAQLVLPTDSLKITDGVCAVFGKKYLKSIDPYDAPKIWNFEGDNMELIRDSNALSIDCRPIPVITDTLFVRLYLYNKPYALRIFSQNLPGNLPAKAWLVDKYLHTQTEIDLYDTTLYDFTPVKNADNSMDTNSYRNRFMIVFNRQLNADAVPITKSLNQGNPNETGEAINRDSTEGSISINPNPVNENKFTLQFSNMLPGEYETNIYNSKGQKLGRQIIQNPGGNASFNMPVPPSWAPGVYTIIILNNTFGKIANLKFTIIK